MTIDETTRKRWEKEDEKMDSQLAQPQYSKPTPIEITRQCSLCRLIITDTLSYKAPHFFTHDQCPKCDCKDLNIISVRTL